MTETAKLALTGMIVAAGYKNDAIRKLIWNLKYHSISGMAETLAVLMTDFLIREELDEYFTESLVVPVPLHRRRLLERGHNHAAEIAKRLAANLDLEYAEILQKIKTTKSQVDLEKPQRLENVKGAFAAMPSLSLNDRKVLLVDDVASTGATLNECAQVLKEQGAKEIWGLVVARN